MSKFSHPNVDAKKARDAFRKVAPKVAADETRDIHRKIAAQFEEFRDTQVPDSMRGLAKRNVAETRGLYERSKKTLQAVLESWEKSFGAAAQDAVALNRKAIDIAERSINSGFDFTASLAGAKNLAAPAIKLKESWQIAKSIALCAKGRLLTKTPLVLHHNVYTDETPNILIPMFCWPNRGRFSRPKNLAIMLVHNRDYKTRLEQSLDYLGIQGYSVVRPCLPRGEWTHSVKIPAFLSFAQSCEEDYILYIDSDDAILLGDPQRALGLLRKSGAEILLND